MATEASGWQWLPFRDTEQLMAAVTSATGVQTADTRQPVWAYPPAVRGAGDGGRRLDDGGGHRAAAVPARPLQPCGRPGTGGLLAAIRKHPDNRETAHRSRVGRRVGSGARTAVQRAHGAGEVLLYDGTTRTATVPVANGARLRTLGGSYALIGQQVFDVAGPRVDTGPAVALFGSLIVERSPTVRRSCAAWPAHRLLR